ncbi:MAG: hypothetical protein Q7J34_06750 [Bacteroidales bacterium]|jgi:hypothetical protein|nr:hypothetical protein [Bacteroidales bacterium]
MQKIILYIIVITGFASCSIIKKPNRNQIDETGKREGRWVQYWDENSKIKLYDGWFLDDIEYKKSKFYDSKGVVYASFRYRKNYLKVRYYDEGRLERKGRAIILRTKDDIAYYFHGKWKIYNKKGRLIRISEYDMGKEKRIFFMRDSLDNKIRFRPPKVVPD